LLLFVVIVILLLMYVFAMRIRGNVHFDSFATKKTEQIFVQILCAEQYVEAGAESAVRRRVLDVRSANDI